MTSYESFEGGAITIVHNDRVALTTTGKLVNLLPAAYDYSGTINCVFADPPKAIAYMHQAFLSEEFIAGDWTWVRGSRCVAWVSVPGREWTQETVICPIPSPDIDFVVVNARFQQTVAPNATWCGRNVVPMVDQSVSIPFTGSMHLESGDPGLNRMASIYRSGSNLVLHQQETIVSMAPEHFGTWTTGGSEPFYRTDWTAVGAPGLPVFAGDGSPWRRNNTYAQPSVFQPSWNQRCNYGGPEACSIPSDPTNYGSTWSIGLHVMFGTVSKAT